MRKVNLGIVGCGAITQQYHLPASKLVPNIDISVVVDKNIRLAEDTSRNYEVPHFFTDYHKIFDLVDGVLIALPNNLHASVSIDFLRRGIPVLCEKPIATSSHEAEEMLRTSKRFNAPLAIGLVRRFYRSSKLVNEVLSNNILGDLHYFDFEEGTIFDWPTKSGFFFDSKASGGGVLMDTGVHALDLLLWWLCNDILDFKYCDDNLGGIEANCELDLIINYRNNKIKGKVELSRTRELRNSLRLFGAKGWLEFFPFDCENIRLHLSKKEKNYAKYNEVHASTRRGNLYYFAKQLMDFGLVVAGEKKPYVGGRLPYEGIKLIEACYNKRENIPMPWITNSLNSNQIE